MGRTKEKPEVIEETTEEVVDEVVEEAAELEDETEQVEPDAPAFADRVKKVKPKNEKDADKLRELVPIRLIKTKQEQGDLIVRVNGYAYQIQRGVVVNVPRFIKEVIDHKELQEQEALDRQIELQIKPEDKAFL